MMKPWKAILALILVIAPEFSFGQSFASDTSTCGIYRNNTPGAPFLAEPNRANTQAAQLAAQFNDHKKVLFLLRRIHQADAAALSQLPPTTPRIDNIIDRHVTNLVWARSLLGEVYEDGRADRYRADLPAAIAAYQRAVDTAFTDDRGCLHKSQTSLGTRIHLAGMYLYGLGVAPDPAKARVLFDKDSSEKSKAIVSAIDRNELPKTYQDFLTLAANGMTPPGPSEDEIREQQMMKGILTIFHYDTDPPPSWIGFLFIGALISLLTIVLIAIVKETRQKISADGMPRSFFAVFDLLRAAVGRLSLFFKGALSAFVALTGFYSFYGRSFFGDILTPWIVNSFDYIVVVVLVGIILGGLFSVIEAFRGAGIPSNTQVHGSARPADEQEARNAAKGNIQKANLHDRVFED